MRGRLDASVAALRDELERRSAAGDADHADELEAVLHRGASMRGELRGAVDLAVSWQGEGTPPEDPVRHKRPRRPELGVHPPWPILRANLTPHSSAFRHAARLSVTIAIAATIYRVFDLPRGYWVPLTVFFVLRPDFGSTFTRGLQRYVGTAFGAVLATLIAAAFNPGPLPSRRSPPCSRSRSSRSCTPITGSLPSRSPHGSFLSWRSRGSPSTPQQLTAFSTLRSARP
jgi:uncharacterized membrane protein YccC